MTHTYAFNYVLGNQTIDTMTDVTVTLIDQLETLDQYVQPFLAGWGDRARDSYTEVQKAWDMEAEQMPIELNRAERALTQIANNYLRMEQRGANEIWPGVGR